MPEFNALRIPYDLVASLVGMVEPVAAECCGFLFGHNGDQRTVTEVLPAKNVTSGDKRTKFEIHPLDYLQAENYALQKSLEVIGIYHSHPDHPAVPSENDRVSAHPNLSYMIISVLNKKVSAIRSWRLDSEHRFVEESITEIH